MSSSQLLALGGWLFLFDLRNYLSRNEHVLKKTIILLTDQQACYSVYSIIAYLFSFSYFTPTESVAQRNFPKY